MNIISTEGPLLVILILLQVGMFQTISHDALYGLQGLECYCKLSLTQVYLIRVKRQTQNRHDSEKYRKHRNIPVCAIDVIWNKYFAKCTWFPILHALEQMDHPGRIIRELLQDLLGGHVFDRDNILSIATRHEISGWSGRPTIRRH